MGSTMAGGAAADDPQDDPQHGEDGDDAALEPVVIRDRQLTADAIRSLEATLRRLQGSLATANRLHKKASKNADETRKRQCRAERVSIQARIDAIEVRLAEQRAVLASLDERIAYLWRPGGTLARAVGRDWNPL